MRSNEWAGARSRHQTSEDIAMKNLNRVVILAVLLSVSGALSASAGGLLSSQYVTSCARASSVCG